MPSDARPAGPGEDPLEALVALPGVAAEVEAARQACERLRWHPAMRRRSAECRAEAAVWAARASAALEGARLPVALVRDAVRGARDLPDDAAGRVVAGAARAVAEAERLSQDGARLLRVSPRQSLVRLHVAAVGGHLPDDQVGRPRRGDERARGPQVAGGPDGGPDGPVAGAPADEASRRLDGVVALLSAPTRAPVLVLAAVVGAEILCAAPFVDGNGVVARALQRALVVGRGLDPMGAVVPESALLAEPARCAEALQGYATGGPEGVAAWLTFTASTVVAGATEGTVIADAVLAGRAPRS